MPGFVLAEGDAPAMSRPRKYPDELRERAVRLVFESKRPIAHVAQDLRIHKESLRHWARQAEADTGRRRDLLSSEEREELKRLRKENAELRRANAILKDAYTDRLDELGIAPSVGSKGDAYDNAMAEAWVAPLDSVYPVIFVGLAAVAHRRSWAPWPEVAQNGLAKAALDRRKSCKLVCSE